MLILKLTFDNFLGACAPHSYSGYELQHPSRAHSTNSEAAGFARAVVNDGRRSRLFNPFTANPVKALHFAILV